MDIERQNFMKELDSEIKKKKSKTTTYQCGSCENEFKKPKDNECPHCGSGNFVEGCIDEPK